MSTYQLHTIPGVEIFSAGTHRGEPYTRKDLDRIVRNFYRLQGDKRFGDTENRLDPTCVLGHEEDEDQMILKYSGLPAAGVVKRLRRKGDKLIADFADVPEPVANAVKNRNYRKVSAELYDNFEDGGKDLGLTLRRVALLGGEIPEIKNLADLPFPQVQKHSEQTAKKLYTFSELRFFGNWDYSKTEKPGYKAYTITRGKNKGQTGYRRPKGEGAGKQSKATKQPQKTKAKKPQKPQPSARKTKQSSEVRAYRKVFKNVANSVKALRDVKSQVKNYEKNRNKLKAQIGNLKQESRRLQELARRADGRATDNRSFWGTPNKSDEQDAARLREQSRKLYEQYSGLENQLREMPDLNELESQVFDLRQKAQNDVNRAYNFLQKHSTESKDAKEYLRRYLNQESQNFSEVRKFANGWAQAQTESGGLKAIKPGQKPLYGDDAKRVLQGQQPSQPQQSSGQRSPAMAKVSGAVSKAIQASKPVRKILSQAISKSKTMAQDVFNGLRKVAGYSAKKARQVMKKMFRVAGTMATNTMQFMGEVGKKYGPLSAMAAGAIYASTGLAAIGDDKNPTRRALARTVALWASKPIRLGGDAVKAGAKFTNKHLISNVLTELDIESQKPSSWFGASLFAARQMAKGAKTVAKVAGKAGKLAGRIAGFAEGDDKPNLKKITQAVNLIEKMVATASGTTPRKHSWRLVKKKLAEIFGNQSLKFAEIRKFAKRVDVPSDGNWHDRKDRPGYESKRLGNGKLVSRQKKSQKKPDAEQEAINQWWAQQPMPTPEEKKAIDEQWNATQPPDVNEKDIAEMVMNRKRKVSEIRDLNNQLAAYRSGEIHNPTKQKQIESELQDAHKTIAWMDEWMQEGKDLIAKAKAKTKKTKRKRGSSGAAKKPSPQPRFAKQISRLKGREAKAEAYVKGLEDEAQYHLDAYRSLDKRSRENSQRLREITKRLQGLKVVPKQERSQLMKEQREREAKQAQMDAQLQRASDNMYSSFQRAKKARAEIKKLTQGQRTMFAESKYIYTGKVPKGWKKVGDTPKGIKISKVGGSGKEFEIPKKPMKQNTKRQKAEKRLKATTDFKARIDGKSMRAAKYAGQLMKNIKQAKTRGDNPNKIKKMERKLMKIASQLEQWPDREADARIKNKAARQAYNLAKVKAAGSVAEYLMQKGTDAAMFLPAQVSSFVDKYVQGIAANVGEVEFTIPLGIIDLPVTKGMLNNALTQSLTQGVLYADKLRKKFQKEVTDQFAEQGIDEQLVMELLDQIMRSFGISSEKLAFSEIHLFGNWEYWRGKGKPKGDWRTYDKKDGTTGYKREKSGGNTAKPKTQKTKKTTPKKRLPSLSDLTAESYNFLQNPNGSIPDGQFLGDGGPRFFNTAGMHRSMLGTAWLATGSIEGAMQYLDALYPGRLKNKLDRKATENGLRLVEEYANQTGIKSWPNYEPAQAWIAKKMGAKSLRNSPRRDKIEAGKTGSNKGDSGMSSDIQSIYENSARNERIEQDVDQLMNQLATQSPAQVRAEAKKIGITRRLPNKQTVLDAIKKRILDRRGAFMRSGVMDVPDKPTKFENVVAEIENAMNPQHKNFGKLPNVNLNEFTSFGIEKIARDLGIQPEKSKTKNIQAIQALVKQVAGLHQRSQV